MRVSLILLGVLVVLAPAASVSAQTPVTAVAPDSPPPPMTGKERIDWVVAGNASLRSLAAGVVIAGWDTAVNTPPEWRRTWDGYGKRYMTREVDLAVANSMEAGLGMLWDEDPRYFRAAHGPLKARIGHALRETFMARRHDGEIPAYGRYTANVAGVFIGNLYRPPSASTAGNTTISIAESFVGKSLANLWEEFWPDVVRRVHH